MQSTHFGVFLGSVCVLIILFTLPHLTFIILENHMLVLNKYL
jgi:hypothetical protein